MAELPLSATFHAEQPQFGGQKEQSHSAPQVGHISTPPAPKSKLKSVSTHFLFPRSFPVLIDWYPFTETLYFVGKVKIWFFPLLAFSFHRIEHFVAPPSVSEIKPYIPAPSAAFMTDKSSRG